MANVDISPSLFLNVTCPSQAALETLASSEPGETCTLGPFMSLARMVIGRARLLERGASSEFYLGAQVSEEKGVLTARQINMGNSFDINWPPPVPEERGQIISTPISVPATNRDVYSLVLSGKNQFTMNVDQDGRVTVIAKGRRFTDPTLQDIVRMEEAFSRAGRFNRRWIDHSLRRAVYRVGFRPRFNPENCLEYLSSALRGSNINLFTGRLEEDKLTHYDPDRRK